ncbi:MAG: riboflavin synthase [Endomicrobiaceae bacterium]|nr:riboflavin synthase [Endomicrobiaceae bacterium]
MFTGITEDIGKVTNITDSQIQIETCLNDIKTGDSVAVNGVCLTVTEIKGKNLSFDYSPTTSDITNISSLKKNSFVNLERALTLQTRLGGHIVSGHIDTSTKIVDIKKSGNFYFISFAVNEEIKKYIVKKGFIAIDGISLTVAETNERVFSVTMIPETFNKTIFHTRKEGDIVNIEIDVFAKYVEKLFNKKEDKKEITMDLLKENGFI